jgi:hypothetical protein
MSFVDGDEYGDEYGHADSGRRGTRTRLPEKEGGARAPVVRPGKSLVTIVGVIVLLIAAMAFATRGGGDGDGDDGGGDQARSTAPTGEKPVESGGDIPSGFPRTEQGVESAAANYAVVLGGDGMFRARTRHSIVEAVYVPDTVGRLQDDLDKAYSASFLENLGLDAAGEPPEDTTFVSRVNPIGTRVTDFGGAAATVEVWCVGLIGVAGEDSTNPVTETWFTITQELAWSDGDWKITSSEQQEGPTPIPGDNRASSADEITEAVEGYGGFTYAR